MAGTPLASHDHPLYGVMISLEQRVMAELAMEMENAGGILPVVKGELREPGIRLARWDNGFTEALLRLLRLGDSATDTVVLGEARLREVLYAILKGGGGHFCPADLWRWQRNRTFHRSCVVKSPRTDLD